ncbi:MAG: hypothetical protein IPH80_21560 [Myxococcales bacterium]|nr:hypothetical protein [Myxococcales bacterium]
MRIRTVQGVLIGVVACLAACQFERPRNVDVDARELDAPPIECTASTATCSNDRYTECDASGRYTRYQVPNGGGVGMPATLVMHDFACPLGCADATRCANPVPSHGLASTLPTWAGGGVDVDLTTSNGSVISLDTNASGTEVELADAVGNTFRVPVEVITQAGGPEILVLKVRTLTIRGPARVVATGARALAVAAAFDIVVEGRLDASAAASAAGATGTGTCVAPSALIASGGGGNRYAGSNSSHGDLGGQAQPGPQPILIGGCAGGAIGVTAGGAPGGAIQLVSRTQIAITSGGVLSVAGGGGRAFAAPEDGLNRATGGGSGGQIVLEAPVIQIAPTAYVVGRGGSGAAAKSGQTSLRMDGVAGDADVTSATVPGPTCTGCGFGGDGGLVGAPPGQGSQGSTGMGGGGGSVGRATLTARTSTVTPPMAAMLVEYTLATLPRD